MRKLISWLLAVCILWMSTWMVTDIHNVAAAERNQAHPVFSIQVELSDPVANFDIESLDCEVCSYDHGGHTGQAMIIERLTCVQFDCRATCRTCDISAWPSHITAPKQRPPIA